jgi:hypothetical protein
LLSVRKIGNLALQRGEQDVGVTNMAEDGSEPLELVAERFAPRVRGKLGQLEA